MHAGHEPTNPAVGTQNRALQEMEVWEEEQEQEIATEDLHLGWTGYQNMNGGRLLGISTYHL
jgi:hypothetical protein